MKSTRITLAQGRRKLLFHPPIKLELTELEAADLEYFLRKEGEKYTDPRGNAAMYHQRMLCRKLANQLGEALSECLRK